MSGLNERGDSRKSHSAIDRCIISRCLIKGPGRGLRAWPLGPQVKGTGCQSKRGRGGEGGWLGAGRAGRVGKGGGRWGGGRVRWKPPGRGPWGFTDFLPGFSSGE